MRFDVVLSFEVSIPVGARLNDKRGVLAAMKQELKGIVRAVEFPWEKVDREVIKYGADHPVNVEAEISCIV